MKLLKYWHLWTKIASLSLQLRLVTWGASCMYILGKFIRFGFFLTAILIVLRQTNTLAGYNLKQMIVFFLIFELIDILGQLFYRGIYLFRNEVITGHFDMFLVKPVNELFLALTNQVDMLDMPLLVVCFYIFFRLQLTIALVDLLTFLAITFCSLIIVTAVHIFVASIGLLTTEVDNLMMIYRDLSLMAKVPIDIYLPSVRFILTYIIPIALIFTFPAKALLGLLTWPALISTFFVALFIFWLSLKFWQFALTQYSSASS